MPKTIMMLLFLLSYFATPAQPYERLVADRQLSQKRIDEKRDRWMSRVDQKNDPWRSKVYQSRYDYLDYGVQNDHFLYGSAIQNWLDSVVAEICRANPDIPADDIFLMADRYPEPNAASLGDGTILVNTGLLRRLENESQLAFILCHEIAHYTLAHLETDLEHYAAAAADKDREKQLKRLGRKGNYTEIRGLLQQMIYDQRRQDREQETAADSLGLVYLARTGYDVHQALRCVEILDSIDQEKYPVELNLGTLFHTNAYPFKSRWLEEEASLFGGAMGREEEEEEFLHLDSLRTHPACRERMQRLAASDEIRIAPEQPGFLPDTASFQQWINAADYELIEGLYRFEATAAALYHCLQLLSRRPEDPYLNTMTGLCLLQVQEAMKEHRLTEQVPLPAGRLPAEFRKLCRFLHHLRLSETAALAYHFLNERAERFSGYDRFAEALAESRRRHGGEVARSGSLNHK